MNVEVLIHIFVAKVLCHFSSHRHISTPAYEGAVSIGRLQLDFVPPSSLLNSHFDKHMNNNHLSNLQKKQTDGHTQSVIQAICIIHYFTTAYVTLRKNRFNSVLRQTYLNTCHWRPVSADQLKHDFVSPLSLFGGYSDKRLHNSYLCKFSQNRLKGWNFLTLLHRQLWPLFFKSLPVTHPVSVFRKTCLNIFHSTE